MKISPKVKDFLRPAVKMLRYLANRISLPYKQMRNAPFDEFCFNYHSQNGEDGVVEEIFRRLKTKKGWMVEFGAWDGIYLSNTFHFLETNRKMQTIYIECDTERCKDLFKTISRFPRQITAIKAMVLSEGKNSLDSLLEKTPIPYEFDLLSIDVDGMDYQIWKNFNNYKPKIVIIEINSSIPLGIEQINDGASKRGSSFTSMLKLGNMKGYTCVHHRGNMFFVRDDLLNKIGIGDMSIREQESLFK